VSAAAPALLTRVAAGEDEAVSQLMRTFSPLIQDIARRHRSTGSSGDDLVQETMLRLWRSADRFDAARGNETGFVAAVARNAAIDMSRRRATRTSIPVADPDDVLPPVAFPSDSVATTVTVRAALEKLPPAQRQLLRLAYFEQLTQPEIADRLGVPVGTVKSRTFQALRVLRSILQEG
jgi:RNA polymerase sigma-70 factor (ECF subfamily)